MTTYRAAFYVRPDSQGETVLTRPEEADLPDSDLIARAITEAYAGDIVSAEGDEVRLSEADLRSGLRIGTWGDR